MAHTTRRDFLKAGMGATLLAGMGRAALAQAGKRSATDWVTLGRSGVKVTRLARGLPSGSVLEFANAQMLADALEGRRTF